MILVILEKLRLILFVEIIINWTNQIDKHSHSRQYASSLY